RTPRATLASSMPIMYAKRKNGSTHDRIFHSSGIGDVSPGARMWLVRPPSESRQNIAFGVGLKLPTGKPDVTNTFRTATGTVTQVVDQSIQLGDGGVGGVFDMQAYKAVKFMTFFAAGGYFFHPPKTHALQTRRHPPPPA